MVDHTNHTGSVSNLLRDFIVSWLILLTILGVSVIYNVFYRFMVNRTNHIWTRRILQHVMAKLRSCLFCIFRITWLLAQNHPLVLGSLRLTSIAYN